MLLENRVALVTGAGRGIGFGIAEAFGREGATVVIGELDAERGRQAAAMLRDRDYRAHAVPLDVSAAQSCAEAVRQAVAEHGRLDILVNNAGIFVFHKSEDMPEADWRQQIDVCLNGVFFMTQAAARAMIPQKRGSIVNIASTAGIGGWAMRSAYGAAKAGVIALTELLATEWAQHNIRVNCISPGVTRTAMVDDFLKTGAVSIAKYSKRIPLGRLAEVSEVAEAVLFLASDRASFVTGENLRVDGGWIPWGNLNCLGFPEEEVRE